MGSLIAAIDLCNAGMLATCIRVSWVGGGAQLWVHVEIKFQFLFFIF